MSPWLQVTDLVMPMHPLALRLLLVILLYLLCLQVSIGSTSALLHANILDTGGETANLSFLYGESADSLPLPAPR